MKINTASLCMTALVMSAIGLVAEEYRTVEEFADARRRYNGEWTYPQDPLASNIYSRVKSMYEGHWLSPFDYFLAVRGGGVEMEMDRGEHEPIKITLLKDTYGIFGTTDAEIKELSDEYFKYVEEITGMVTNPA